MRFRLSFSAAINYVEIVFPALAGITLPAGSSLQCGFGN